MLVWRKGPAGIFNREWKDGAGPGSITPGGVGLAPPGIQPLFLSVDLQLAMLGVGAPFQGMTTGGIMVGIPGMVAVFALFTPVPGQVEATDQYSTDGQDTGLDEQVGEQGRRA